MKNNHALANGTANGGFTTDNLINATELLDAIGTSDKPLALHLRQHFVDAQLLPLPASATADPEKFKTAVVAELNRLIGGYPLYTKERFASTKLSSYTRKLLRKNPTGAKLVTLNKQLLLDALEKHVRRQPGRSKNMVQQPAYVSKLKGGNYGVFVDLVEPRELLGKMRSGRKKFERQTEESANELCAEINAILFGKELARQLTKEEIAKAKKLFWEVLEPTHPDWLDHLKDLVAHCEKTGFRVNQKASCPTVAEAVKLFWEEHVKGHEYETVMNYRAVFGFILPAFGKFKSYELTDATILRMAYGQEPLMFFATSWKKKQTAEEAEKRLWDTPIISDSKRPWSYHMLYRFLGAMRVFKNWMHSSLDPVTREQRNWCPPTTIKLPDEPRLVPGEAGKHVDSKEVTDILCRKNPALTIPQAQALLDIVHVAFDGRFAGFYSHGMFGGSRIKETKRMGTDGFDPEDGVQVIAKQADKKDQGRESQLLDNLIVIIESLKAAGLYTNANLRPNHNQRAAIHILAGFTSNSKQAHLRAQRERKRLAKLGIELPQYSWGVPFPKNGLRRTALSMHFKLFGDEAMTEKWAGNGDVFRPYYKRLVTKAQAREYWVMLPSHLQAAGVKVNLPPGHKLDSAMTPEISAAAQAAGAVIKDMVAKLAEAKAKVVANRPAELKAKIKEYNRRAYAKRQARKLAARQASQPEQPVANEHNLS